MKVGIIGYGKMGRMIHEVASDRGHTVGVILNESYWQSQEIAGLDVSEHGSSGYHMETSN